MYSPYLRGMASGRRAGKNDGIASIDVLDIYGDIFFPRRGQILAHIIGADGNFAVPAVDQYGQLNDGRPSDIAQGIEGSPDGAAGI